MTLLSYIGIQSKRPGQPNILFDYSVHDTSCIEWIDCADNATMQFAGLISL